MQARWPATARGPLATHGHDEEASRDGDTLALASSVARALACMQGRRGRCCRAVGWMEEAQKREQRWLGEALPFSNDSHGGRRSCARQRQGRGERESAVVSGGASGEARNACCHPTRERKSQPRRGTRQQWWSALSCMAAMKTFPQTPGGRGRARLRIQILHIQLRFGS
jgi:hypothetical protein